MTRDHNRAPKGESSREVGRALLGHAHLHDGLIIVAAGHACLEGGALRAQLSRDAATDSGSIGYTSVFVDQKLFDDHTDLAAGRDQNAARQSISWSRAVEVV